MRTKSKQEEKAALTAKITGSIGGGGVGNQAAVMEFRVNKAANEFIDD